MNPAEIEAVWGRNGARPATNAGLARRAIRDAIDLLNSAEELVDLSIAAAGDGDFAGAGTARDRALDRLGQSWSIVADVIARIEPKGAI